MCTRRFTVQWNGHADEIFSHLGKLRCNDRFSDITIYCQGKSFNGHKIILAAGSCVFEHLLAGIPGDKSQVLVIPDVEEKLLKLVLDFMYEGKLDVDADLMEGFVKTAIKFKVLFFFFLNITIRCGRIAFLAFVLS